MIIFQIGVWNEEDGFSESRVVIPPAESVAADSMKGKHFIVLTALVSIDIFYKQNPI